MSNAELIHRCEFCLKICIRKQGIQSHILQTPACRVKFEASLLAAGNNAPAQSDPTDDDDMNMDLPMAPPDVHQNDRPARDTSKRARVEEVEDEGDPLPLPRWKRPFPTPAGSPIRESKPLFEHADQTKLPPYSQLRAYDEPNMVI